MKIPEIIFKSSRPAIYERGTTNMWTDEHISTQLLSIHLNPDVDLASRKFSTIQKTVDWILSLEPEKKKLQILDLGCGPGLYTQEFAKQGHEVTGVDFSASSIAYAKKEALQQKQSINYIQANYLELELPENSYDMVTLIYTDFGVLLPEERARLLAFLHKILKKGGKLVFDVLADLELEKKVSANSWEAGESGFWKATPYLALSNSFLYPLEKVILYQHLVLDENESMSVYRFWTHFFSENDLLEILKTHQFNKVSFSDEILPQTNLFDGKNVLYCIAVKA